MADFYPRRYFPGHADYPPIQPDDLRPYYPPLTRSYYGPDYPPYDPGYPPDRKGYLSSQPEAKPKESDTYVVNKRYKYYGIALIILSIASFGVEVANVVLTYTRFKDDIRSNPELPYILTWLAPGIWGSIPVLVAGVLALRVAGTYNDTLRVFALFCSLCAFVFTPAIIGISIAEIIMYPRYPRNGDQCYSFDDSSSLKCEKFILPVVEATLGGIELYLTIMITIVFCFCWNPETMTDKADNVKVTTKIITEDQPQGYSTYSPYAGRIESRPTTYYRSLPPEKVDSPEDHMVVLPPQSVGPVDMSLLRSYPAYRPATSRGFGMASALNHRVSYGNFAGSTPVAPFYGSIPSLAAFGNPGPNPAYKIVYN